ncbi:MAG: hypothetical protein GY757_58870 [bacterium]|nr:hypothetical protein [bacterium]
MERFELLGQRDDVNIISLAATQLMWSAMSPTLAVKRIGQLASYLKKKLIESEWEFVTPEKEDTSWAIIRVEAHRDENKIKLVDYLYEKGIAGAEGGGSPGEETLRLCPTIYNLKKHLDYVVKCMNEWKHG